MFLNAKASCCCQSSVNVMTALPLEINNISRPDQSNQEKANLRIGLFSARPLHPRCGQPTIQAVLATLSPSQ